MSLFWEALAAPVRTRTTFSNTSDSVSLRRNSAMSSLLRAVPVIAHLPSFSSKPSIHSRVVSQPGVKLASGLT
jgi:hypothetical protein